MTSSLTPVRLFVEISVIIALVQTLVMALLPTLALGLTGVAEGLVGAALLVLLCGPVIYWRCMAAMRTPRTTTQTPKGALTKIISIRSAIGMTAAAQIAGLAVTGGVVMWLKLDLDRDAQIQFDQGTERIEAEMKRRFNQVLLGLKGAHGAYAVSQNISRQEFNAYVQSRDLPNEFPGIRGFGFIAQVQRSYLDTFIAKERADFAPEFSVRTQGNAADLFIIKYIEPIAPNRAAMGFDIGQEAVRREAAERAMNSGQPALTGKIVLMQDDKQSPGMLYLLPVYRHGSDPTTQAQHQAALVGLLYAPIVAAELSEGLADMVHNTLRIEIFDASSFHSENLLFDSHAARDGATAAPKDVGNLPVLAAVRSIAVGGRNLGLRVSSTPAFHETLDRSSLALASLAGALASLLLSLAVWLLAVGRLRAQRMAERMTADLDHLARVVQHTTNAVSIADSRMRITWVNEGFTRLTGYTLEEARGRTPGELLGSGKTDPAIIDRLLASVEQGLPCRVEVVNRAKDGHEYWVDTEVQPTRDARGVLTGFMEIGTDVTERKRAEQKSDEMSHRMSLATEGGSDGLWDWMDVQEDAQWWSPNYYALLGYNPQEMPALASSYLALLHPDSQELSLKATQDALAGLRPFDLEVLLQTKEQGYRWFRTRAKVHFDEKGRAARMSGSTQDIHNHKLAQNALQESEAFLDRAGRIAGVGGWSVHIDTGKLHWSKETRRIHEVDDSYEPVVEQAICFYAPEARPVIERAVREAMERGTPWDLELPLVTAKGRAIWVRAMGEVEFRNHKPERLVGAFQDITARRARDQDLHLLESCVSRIQDAILITRASPLQEPGPEIVFVNRAFEALTGYSQAESLGRTPRMLQGPNTDRAALARIGEAIARAESVSEELLNYHKDGTPYWIEISISPVRTELGEVGHFVAVTRDVTQRRLNEAALRDALTRAEQASVAKGQFVANMSHEIRTPMNAILGLLQLLKDTSLAEVQRDFVDKTEGAARSLLGLLNDILDFSKVEAGKLALDPRVFNLDQILADVSVILRSNLSDKPLLFGLDVETDVPRGLLGDDMRLKQVLINLGGNAIKFTTQGEVLLRVRQVERSAQDVVLEFAVCDSGIGIAPEHQEHIFKGFSQAEASTTRRYGGTGLGLSISSRLVGLLGGVLQLKSVEGQGSTFYFQIRFPLAELPGKTPLLHHRADAAEVAPAQPEGLQGLRILVVEDNKINQLVAKGLLVKMGAEVTLADDGQLGVAAVATANLPFDAVLMDVQMPVMDGYAATRAIRQDLGMKDLPIVAMTANAMASDRVACLEAGMNDHVGKPFELDHLVATLQSLVGRRVD